MRLVRTARAEEDLIDIWTYNALDDERAADRVLDELERKTTMLASTPNIRRERFDIAAGVRSGSSPLCSRAAAIEGARMKMLIGKIPPVAIPMVRSVG
jgi:plasmid stabilization system protein ParE